MHLVARWGLAGAISALAATGKVAPQPRPGTGGGAERVRPGISVLLEDSLHLVRGKRVGLLTNQTGVDERGRSDVELLTRDPRAREARVRLVTLFAPEHGLRGTEDRTHLASGVDERSGLPVISLYGATTVAPPDSALRELDVLLFDLQDVGTRTWTYVGAMLYAMRASARVGIPFVVLDRPNPITGAQVDGPMLAAELANPEDHRRGRPGRAYALYPFPLRHGMTMGEMARFFNDTLRIGAALHVVPVRGWRRAMWFDQTGLPWVRPSPNMASLASATLYPALVPFEATNLSVGRGTAEPFERFGAPWLGAEEIAALLNERGLAGVRFVPERFTPRRPSDGRYGGVRLPGVRVEVTDRERLQPGRIAATLLWALHRLHGEALRVRTPDFDLLMGSAAVREALLRGEDPDSVLDREARAVAAFQRAVRPYLLYR